MKRPIRDEIPLEADRAAIADTRDVASVERYAERLKARLDRVM